MSEAVQEIISVANVADGNPSTAWSLANQLRDNGGNPTEVLLTTTSIPVNYFHRDISADHHEAKYYTQHSEAQRLNIKSRFYAAACFGEFATRLMLDRSYDREIPSRWTIIQEHQLLGAWETAIDALGITDIRVVVPDVYPKESAKHAVKNTVGASFSVWNTNAHAELLAEGFKAELHKPYLLDGFRPMTQEFCDEGEKVVVKSSGNGMPKEWADELLSVLSANDFTWSFHTPEGQTSDDSAINQKPAKRERIQNFYNSLGGKTKILIGYPSELVGVVCEMRSRGVQVWMIALPPRGAHELRNLQFAVENQLVLGELSPKDYFHTPTFPELQPIKVPMIQSIVADLPEAKWSGGLIGTNTVWE